MSRGVVNGSPSWCFRDLAASLHRWPTAEMALADHTADVHSCPGNYEVRFYHEDQPLVKHSLIADERVGRATIATRCCGDDAGASLNTIV